MLKSAVYLFFVNYFTIPSFLMESTASADKNINTLSYTEIEPSEKFGPGEAI
jgi:hypothetical protein